MQTGSTRTGSSEWYSRRRKTDISFLISGMMNLYEHQSTFNPNMPVRGLIYLCRLYEKYIVKNEIDIYTSSLKELPFPQYFVFYNGTEKEPDRQELKLSDMFKAPPVSRTPALECIATMLNINYGHNKELMEKCQRLREYAVFVETVRQELTSGTDFDQSVANAVDICINGNILKDILTDQKAEVIQMILETYDKELHDKTLRHEGYEEDIIKVLQMDTLKARLTDMILAFMMELIPEFYNSYPLFRNSIYPGKRLSQKYRKNMIFPRKILRAIC